MASISQSIHDVNVGRDEVINRELIYPLLKPIL